MRRLNFIYWTVCLLWSVTVSHDVPGYYWRDYYGEIPKDAFPGGLDEGNRPIYIGQVFVTHLIPAKIYTTDKKAYYEYGGKEFGVSENVKILCTQHPEQFEWIKTDVSFNSITGKYLVLGGFEPGATTYIGRVRYGGEISIGKALADNDPKYMGLHITRDGKGIRHLDFDVLAFNRRTKEVNMTYEIQ